MRTFGASSPVGASALLELGRERPLDRPRVDESLHSLAIHCLRRERDALGDQLPLAGNLLVLPPFDANVRWTMALVLLRQSKRDAVGSYVGDRTGAAGRAMNPCRWCVAPNIRESRARAALEVACCIALVLLLACGGGG